MKPTQFALPLLSLALCAGAANAQPQGYGPPPPQAYGQDGGWEAPPAEFRAAMQRGFHDGIEGARRDFQNHRPPNVNNRDEFHNPHVPGPDRHDYRQGFRRGYDVGVRHIYGSGPGYGPR